MTTNKYATCVKEFRSKLALLGFHVRDRLRKTTNTNARFSKSLPIAGKYVICE